ncbi:hypothetical protein Poly51_37950 [Rubripirellula tenax]|uniref:Tetratricopeptide repeat protein n=1 Tax=Rubripirellula tenax TaxID=2528015 RepID=A0A5C6EPI9_9BACT|nr:hypothetical protein [Rubripirellula tenax]TWU50505.1 hypothetical protein Poly51_37950 [Rubripirellula tenax]
MQTRYLSITFAIALGFLSQPTLRVAAQSPEARRAMKQQQQAQQQMQQRMREIAESQAELPTDPQLLTLHKEFVAKAEKLATEFERKKQFEKAREVYESLVRLVPSNTAAEQALQRILGNQAMQDKKLVDVQANQGWQDSGASLVEGMPVRIGIKGTWKVVYETGPGGIEIPEEMRPKDGRIKLGSLIAVIASSPKELEDGKPMLLSDGKDFIAEKSGRLFLRMFDIDPSDNDGKIYVLIQSTFE